MSLSAPQQRRTRNTPLSAAHSLSGPSSLPAGARADAAVSPISATGHVSSGSGSSLRESDADARLRHKEDGPAFGGRRGSNTRAGALLGLRKREWVILSAVCIIASFVRLWDLATPTSVV